MHGLPVFKQAVCLPNKLTIFCNFGHILLPSLEVIADLLEVAYNVAVDMHVGLLAARNAMDTPPCFCRVDCFEMTNDTMTYLKLLRILTCGAA